MYKIKNKLLVIFFVIHLILIFLNAVGTTLEGYWNYHKSTDLEIPFLSGLNNLQSFKIYRMYTGTDTGYGFYGIKTATVKYFKLTLYDDNYKIISNDRYFGLKSSNGISRFAGYASYLSNYISETEKMIENNSDSKDQILEIAKYRETYVNKVFKWLGKKQALKVKNCTEYSIEIITIIPENINTRETNLKPKIYVVKKGLFPVE